MLTNPMKQVVIPVWLSNTSLDMARVRVMCSKINFFLIERGPIDDTILENNFSFTFDRDGLLMAAFDGVTKTQWTSLMSPINNTEKSEWEVFV